MTQNLNIHDIHKRLRGIKANNSPYNNSFIQENVNISIKNGIPKDIMKSIEYCCKKSNPFMFESVLTLFDALYECDGTVGQINKMSAYICEEAVPKVRNAKETNSNLRRKLGRMKSKIATKIDNNINDAKSEILGKIHAAQNNYNNNSKKLKNNIKSGLGMKSQVRNEAYIAGYENMIKTFSKYEDCDRILENYDKISRRFNLERLFIENTRINGFEDTVNELCKFIETYDMPNIVKYNTVIETAWYGFENNDIEYNQKKMIEAATDYFLMKPNGYNDCKRILENTTIINPKYMPANMQVITELDPEDENSNVFKMNVEIKDQIMEMSSIVMEDTNFNKIFNDFKKQEDEHKENKLMMLVRKLYTKNVSNIVDETPNFLNWIRLVFVLGTCALNPVLGVITFIGDIFARLHFERDETEKMIKCFENEIKKSETKMKSINDPEEKQRLKEYINSLKKANQKINDYYDKMLTDKELDKKFDDSSTDVDSFEDIKIDITSDNDDDDWDDFDWDDDSFLESAVNTISIIDNLTDELKDFNTIGMDTITNMDIFNADDIDSLAKLSVMYPEVWGPELMENAFYGELYKIKKGRITFESSITRFQMINAYESGIKTIHSFKPDQFTTVKEAVYNLNNLIESAEAIDQIIYAHKNKNLMVEGSFMNSIKLASEKLKKTMVKLSDKDKTISKNIDVSLSQFKKSMENTLTNENREAVIKGSVLPSASKIIKLAITTGAIWLVNPAVAVIGALGYLGLSAKHKAKERQLILDELETELKICEKYIDIAESKNDMKSLKQLYSIQKNLQRQHQRIRYKMKVDFNQNTTSSDPNK